MKKLATITLLCALMGIASSGWAQNGGAIKGTVTDQESGKVMPGVNVSLVGTTRGAATDGSGVYEITNVAEGQYRIKATYLGFATFESEPVSVVAGKTTTVDIQLEKTVWSGDEVVVSGSKQPEKLLESPTTIERISSEELATSGGNTFMSSIANLKGINFSNAGVNTQLVSARGFNSSFNTRMLFLIDGRIATLGGTGLPQGNFLPSSKIDLKSIEVVLGPAAALYGPNAGSGVINVTTKDPWDQSGVTVAAKAGNQKLRDITYRVAGTVNNSFGWKVTGQYMKAVDFKPKREDSLHFYQTAGTKPTSANTVFESDVVENYDVGATKINGSLYYKMGDWKVSGTYGWSSTDQFSLTSNGRNRIKDWEVDYQTLQVSGSHWYAQFSRTGNKAGSYQLNQVVPAVQAAVNAGASLDQVDIESIRESVSFIDDTQIYDSELQYNNTFGALSLVTGVQYRKFMPESKGTYLQDGSGQDISRELMGGYLQVDYDVIPDQLQLVAAARLDGNSDYDMQFSPKGSLVFTAAPGHNIRATYNRAYTTPTILQSHAYIPVPDLFAPNYDFLIKGNNEGYTIKDAGGNVVNTIDPTNPEEVNSVELGYKGIFGEKLFVDVVGYISWYKNFIGTDVVADGANTIAYQNGSPVMVQGSNFTALQTYINFGEATVQGFDIGLNYYFNDNYSISASMSTIKLTDFTNETTDATLPLNTPPLKVKGGITAKNIFDSSSLQAPFFKIKGRWQDSYQYNSGYWNTNVLLDDDGDLTDKEELPAKFQLDLSTGFDIADTGLSVQGSVNNVFDNEKVDLLGAAPQGRTYWLSVKYNFDGLRL
ncbi:TonB-dependent receptor [Fodinibius halophilus]|uniref:TonB-dependent receptor n=1 Tax=Fodinibius halophilus TaxID=1736908 RepID=A0A6M1TFF9_9BACT|nr:TonB-dependent receptor [Fodinibius halophilus]NGP89534.1 TonB-dependent receptor [Fodinibius halophilus]